ncbi:unnamed protein product, partial [Mesorhabditis spiculigera]
MADVAGHAIPSIDMINATSKLQLEAAEVRANKPNWGSYLRSQMIPQDDYNFIVAYEGSKSKAERDAVLAANGENGQAVRTFVSLISNVAKDQNVRYVLTLLDDMLQEDKSRVELFHDAAKKQKKNAWQWFLGILQRQDNFIVNQMSSVIAKLACYGSTLMDGSDLSFYFSFLQDQLKNVQVIRIILATFRNILEKAGEHGEREIVREAALQMVQCKTLKTLELMDSKKFDDPDLEEDIEYLNEKLHLSVQDLSSFDEYVGEVKSGRLQWSPVHKSDKFWRENAERFNDKRWDIVKTLIRLLETASDVLTLCVAAHDIGEYVRHYPRGKTFVEQNNGKSAVMKLLSAEDPNVRYHALLAIQKLMVHNWEYLGKQLQKDAPESVTAK